MHIVRMKLGNIPPFTEPVQLEFDEHVNVFIGPNASGKSTLLKILENRFGNLPEDGKRPITQGRGYRLPQLFTDDEFDEAVSGTDHFQPIENVVSGSVDWLGTKEDFRQPCADPPLVHVGPDREGLPGVSNLAGSNTYGDAAEAALNGRYSALRTMWAAWLLGDELWGQEPDESAPYARVALMDGIELGDSCSKTICNEVIQDHRSYNYIPGLDIRWYLQHPQADVKNIVVHRLVGIKTNDVRNFGVLSELERPSFPAYEESPEDVPLYLGHLSSGTETTLLWIRWLVLKMLVHYNFAADWEKKPAILLIDEVENHLHPTWQRRVIPALLEHFPGLQIFATTHSPFVVAGLKAGQVHLLSRDENGVVTAKTNPQDIIGWTMDEILRAMMGVSDPTDEETAKAARELRELRNSGPAPTEGEEEKRQERIRELRQKVDRDLLAGGPAAAQREIFEEQFAAALEKYRQSGGLNQENG